MKQKDYFPGSNIRSHKKTFASIVLANGVMNDYRGYDKTEFVPWCKNHVMNDRRGYYDY